MDCSSTNLPQSEDNGLCIFLSALGVTIHERAEGKKGRCILCPSQNPGQTENIGKPFIREVSETDARWGVIGCTRKQVVRHRNQVTADGTMRSMQMLEDMWCLWMDYHFFPIDRGCKPSGKLQSKLSEGKTLESFDPMQKCLKFCTVNECNY